MDGKWFITYRVFFLILPFLAIALYFFMVSILLDPGLLGKYASLSLAYFFPPAGKESVIPLMLTNNSFGSVLPIWATISAIVVMDVISSIIISYNWWFVEIIITHVPFLDKGYDFLQRKSEKYQGRGLVEIPLLIFMAIPFQGTGGISTSIIARIVGVSPRKTVLICFIGSLITTVLWTLWWTGFFSFFNNPFVLHIQ